MWFIHQIQVICQVDITLLLRWLKQPILNSLEQNMETKQITSEWGISSYPALVAVHIKKGKIVTDNELVWNPDLPFTAMDIEQWLSLNGLYNFDIQPTGQESEQ